MKTTECDCRFERCPRGCRRRRRCRSTWNSPVPHSKPSSKLASPSPRSQTSRETRRAPFLMLLSHGPSFAPIRQRPESLRKPPIHTPIPVLPFQRSSLAPLCRKSMTSRRTLRTPLPKLPPCRPNLNLAPLRRRSNRLPPSALPRDALLQRHSAHRSELGSFVGFRSVYCVPLGRRAAFGCRRRAPRRRWALAGRASGSMRVGSTYSRVYMLLVLVPPASLRRSSNALARWMLMVGDWTSGTIFRSDARMAEVQDQGVCGPHTTRERRSRIGCLCGCPTTAMFLSFSLRCRCAFIVAHTARVLGVFLLSSVYDSHACPAARPSLSVSVIHMYIHVQCSTSTLYDYATAWKSRTRTSNAELAMNA